MTINRELSQFASFVNIDDSTKNIGIATTSTPSIGIGTASPSAKFEVVGNTKLQSLNVTGIGTVETLSSPNGTITNLTGTSGTITTFNSTNGTITNLTGTSGTITTLNSTSGTITNLTGTAGTITTFNSTNGTITNGTITNLTGTAGTITTFNSTTGTITNLNSTTGTITNVTVSGLTSTGSLTVTGASVLFLQGIDVTGTASIDALTVFPGPSNLSGQTNLFNALNVAGITTLANSGGITTTGGNLYVGSDLYVARNANITGISTFGNTVVGGATTQLIVTGNARITGILTIGTSSLTLDGTNNQINVGTGVTIQHTNGVLVGSNTLSSTGLSINAISASGIATFTNGPLLVGTGTSTGTASQPLQVTGGAYVSGSVGIGTTNPTAKLDVIGDARITGVLTATTFSGAVTGIAASATQLVTPRTFQITGDVVASPISFDGTGNVSLAATIQPNSVGLGTDTTGDYVRDITGTVNQITVTGGTGESSTPTLSVPSQFTAPQDVTVTRDLLVSRNLNVNGNITIGGTSATLFTTELKIADPDIVLGFRTDGSGNDISNDNTANHGGVALASTEGTPLVDLFIAGIETAPATYKKIMWFKSGTFSGLGTDAWLINYAVGIGSTQFPTGTRLAAGNVQFTQNDLSVVRNINSSGIVTATTFVGALTGTATSTTNIPNLTGVIISNNTTTSLGSFSSANLATALTDETGTGANVFATSPTLTTPVLGTPSSGTLTSCTGLPLTTGVTGTLPVANGGTGVTGSTGTGSVVLSTSPTLTTPILGTPQSGTLTSCTGLPVSTGVAGLGANVATFLATPSSANLAAALTDETGSGAAVFATSPTLVTPILGSASATNLNVSGVTTSATFDTGVIGSQTSGILTTTATTADQVLDSLPTATFQTARYQVSIACAGQLVTAGMTTGFTSVGAITAGSGYTNTTATYTNVAITGGSGNDARANIGVNTSTGGVASVEIVSPGSGYVTGNTLSATLGTIGSGFSFPVSTVVRNYQSTDVMIMQSVGSAATACDYIEYASLANSEILASFRADISGANARLLVTPTYRNNTLKVIRSGITV